MSISFLSKYVAKSGDTADSIVASFRLSSRNAIADISPNTNFRDILSSESALPPGLIVSIPPNAGDLLRDRTYALHRLAADVRAHFDAITEQASQVLRPVVLDSAFVPDCKLTSSTISQLHASTTSGIGEISLQAWPLVDICVGMSQTHVAQDFDRKAAGTTDDSLCPLYWALTPAKFQTWRESWELATHEPKWRGRTPDDAWRMSAQYHNTVRTIVVQQIDTRIREAQTLARALRAEAD